jgi:hypothetical protein
LLASALGAGQAAWTPGKALGAIQHPTVSPFQWSATVASDEKMLTREVAKNLFLMASIEEGEYTHI